jgi:hypothetical protein
MTGFEAYLLARAYTNKAIEGGGSLKGAACQIKSIEPITGGNRVTFEWEDNQGVVSTDTMDVMNGANGQDGSDGADGVGIVSITYKSEDAQGNYIYTVALSDSTSYDITCPKGAKGDTGATGATGADGQDGADGVGITSITKTGTSGLVDTYTITYTNGMTSTFTVTNGSGADLTAGQYVDITNDVISVKKSIGTVEPFKETVDYSGEVAKVTVPYAGKYKLCVWGASGGNGTDGLSKGGYGGYSEGIVYLSANTDLYVCVGGAGTGGSSGTTAGYNGGGTANHSGSWQRGAGGGATHIATTTGQLNVVSSDNVLIVAGGGGGAGWVNGSEYGTGGSGGGYMGADGIRRNNGTKGNGGTQTAGGTGYEGVGSYGQGGNRTTGQDFGGSGGGGGYYGGGASSNTCGAGGGSGYISTSLADACMYGYGVPESSEPTTKTISVSEYNENPVEKVAKWGNGYATIEYIEDDTSDLVTKGDVETAINAIKDGQSIDSFADVETALGEKADTDIVASDFSTSASYTAGDYCIYEGKFYRFKTTHSGAWAAADVDEIKIAGELSSLMSGLIGLSVDVEAPKRKNILPLSLANIKASNTSGTWSGNAYTANGVTFTVNTDSNGAVTGIVANGTASATTYFTVYNTTESDGNMQGHILNGCPSGGNLSTYLLLASNTVDTVNRDMGSGVTISANDRATFRVQISITNGYAASNIAFAPMVRLASENDPSFAPYIPSVENRIEAVESGLTSKIGVTHTTNLNDCATTGVYTFPFDATGVPSGHSGVMLVMRILTADTGLQIARVSTENTIYVRFFDAFVFSAWQTITLGS